MNKSLSWKILIPVGLVTWLIGKVFQENILGSAIALIGFIILVMGIIAGITALVRRGKKE